MSAPVRVLDSPEAVGEAVAASVLARIAQRRLTAARFLLGCPTGRTPRPVFRAMAAALARSKQDVSHLVLVMMDEYLVPRDGQLAYASSEHPWSCHHFVRAEIVDRLGISLPDDSIWFPDPDDPEAYDRRIDEAGGIDFFMLASGASDGHVAFNPPGSPRDSRTRIIPLSEETRRDNLQTFPAFGTASNVPRHGISAGIDTIARAKEAVMIVWGEAKRLTFSRIAAASRYESDWPATVIHECARGEVVCDRAAAKDAQET
ncbi:MAG: 6-phosphogluconolactonase [Gemmatimonadaceae bacterium]